MARVTVEDCLAEVHDQFALVHLAALRYRQLHRGAKPLVQSKNKKIVTALREIAAGKIQFREDVAEVLLKATLGGVDSIDDINQGLYSEDDLDTPLI